MSLPYSIVEVDESWLLEPEEMGSKSKFWYRGQGHRANWLFKYPQANTGQHWAEKIVAEVADHLGIRHCKVELAVFRDDRGSATESVARHGRELFHGNQWLSENVSDYDSEARFHQSSHTIKNIWSVLDGVGGKKRTDADKRSFAEYLVLDAVVGNTDRHHENWGFLLRQTADRWTGFLAPSFDHGSSLGRELLDERRERLLVANRVGRYSERARGAIYWSEDEPHAPSPLELVRRTVHSHPDIFRPALARLARLDNRILGEIVARIPAEWMTPLARDFAIELMCYNLGALQELVQ